MSREELLRKRIRDVPDFPEPGIVFKDITPLLQDSEALELACELLAEPYVDARVDLVVGIESRGFIFGPPVALRLGAGFAPVRKQGKLPWRTVQQSYALEYGEDVVELHEDAVTPGQRVLIVDDLIATGGTAVATAQLVRKMGALVIGKSFLIELGALNGRGKLHTSDVHAVLTY
ncbi:MAG: adenine phosphoribosyltransferase [Deltaproteobacteria bacterium]|nr:adenine phosphoribosyltransferase [Deltaproteobacteria bacterium]